MNVYEASGPGAGRSARGGQLSNADLNIAALDGEVESTARVPRRRVALPSADGPDPAVTTRDARTYAALSRRSKERLVNGGALNQITAAKFTSGAPVDASVSPIPEAYSPPTLLVGCLASDQDDDPESFLVLRRDESTKRPVVFGAANGYASEKLAAQALVKLTAQDCARPGQGNGRNKAGVVLKIGDRFFAAPVDVHRFVWTAAMRVKNKVRVTDFPMYTKIKVRLAANLEAEGPSKSRSVRKFVCNGETKSRRANNTMTDFQTYRWDMYSSDPYDDYEY